MRNGYARSAQARNGGVMKNNKEKRIANKSYELMQECLLDFNEEDDYNKDEDNQSSN